MELDKIGREQIANTRVVITIESVSSVTWRASADLAAEIANDPDFQSLVEKTLKLGSLDQKIDVLLEKERFVQKKYGDRNYFDSGVSSAAYSAVLDEINRASQSK